MGSATQDGVDRGMPPDYSATLNPLDQPRVARYEAVVLRADIVEFTAMTDVAVAGGLIGAERLASVIGGFLGRAGELVGVHGGQVSALAGDSIVAVWPATPQRSVHQAMLSAIEAAELIDAAANQWRFNDAHIRLRTSISSGELDEYRVGGVDGRWHTIVLGPALAEVFTAARAAGPGELVVSRRAWEAIRGARKALVRDDGSAVVRWTHPSMTAGGRHKPNGSARNTGAAPTASREGGQAAEDFRHLTILFAQLRHPFYADPAHALAQLQRAAHHIQELARRLEGTVYQILADDNVTVAVLLFGLAPWSHEDDASRAVEAALNLHRTGADMGMTTSAGIATGRAFCTAYLRGAERVPAVVGPAMNLAARLMQSGHGVVCDEMTAKASRRHHRFEVRELAPSSLKGKAAPVVAYVPVAAKLPHTSDGGLPLVGRAAQLAALDEAIGELEHGQGGLCLVEGDAGLGKSTLVRETLRRASERHIACSVARAHATEREVSYGVWRDVYQDLLLQGQPAARIRAPTAAIYDALDTDARFAPLLNDILGTNLGDTPDTARLTEEGRWTVTREVLVRCMVRATQSRARLIVIEDLHWIDASSFMLLVALAEAALPVLIVATTRPEVVDDALHDRLTRAPRYSRLSLSALDEDETARVLARALGAVACDAEAAGLVQRRTGGNPLFVEEMGPFLHDRLVLRIRDGRISLTMPLDVANARVDALLVPQGAPGTLEGIVLAKFDRLGASEQRVLRAAGVVGTSCQATQLRAMLPDIDAPELSIAVDGLVRAGFLTRESDDEFAFRHVLPRDIIYNSLSFADRRQLHASLASWITSAGGSATSWDDAVIAHHFREAGDTAAALHYLTRAARQAIARYANLEAVQLLSDALALSDGSRERVDASSRARAGVLALWLARANLGLSRYDETKRHAESGLRALGFPVPSAMALLVPATLRQILLQAMHRIGGIRPPMGDPSARAAAAAAATALENLTEAYFYRGEAAPAVYASFRTLNIAERWRLRSEQARGYASVAGIATLTPFRRIAAHYRRLALETLNELDDAAAAVWVYIVVGLSLSGIGEWERGTAVFTKASTLAESIGDRRRWRDGVENVAALAACQGEWQRALDGVKAMQAAAIRDKDQRYEVLAFREQSFYLLQLGRLDDAAESIRGIAEELDRGVTAEEAPARQDMHALAAALAIERDDVAGARVSADAALREIQAASVATSFPFTYWSCFLVARVYINLLTDLPRDAAPERAELTRRLALVSRALDGQSRIYPIARPSALLCRGALELLSGREARAHRRWKACAERAAALRMPYELSLAQTQLATAGRATPAAGARGLPLFRELPR